MTRDRRLAFDGAVNFRDLGGYPAGPGRQTCWQRVYRSDSLAELSDADLNRLASLDLYGICDFRLPGEAGRKPDRLPADHSMQVLNPGFIPENTEWMLDEIAAGRMTSARVVEEVTGHYRHFAACHVDNYTPYFRMLLEADGRPVLIHCTSGKDRTGWGAALTLLAAGADDATAAADYVMTNDYRRDIGFMFADGGEAAIMETLTSALPVYIETALTELRRIHGPGDRWMEELRLDRAERTRLRELLSEPAP